MAEPWFEAHDLLLLRGADGEQLDAFCWLKVDDGIGEFYVVGVDPARQGAGHRSSMLVRGRARAASPRRGIRTASLYVDADNVAAVRLYRGLRVRRPHGGRAVLEHGRCAPQRLTRSVAHSPVIHLGVPMMWPMDADTFLDDTGLVTDTLDDDDYDTAWVDDGTLPAERYLDRELSWLAFNTRVLELAEDASLPLLERVNFLAIFASNLDEFFMVRVAGLKRRIATGIAVPTNIGRAPADVLASISARAHELQERHSAAFKDIVKPALDEAGIHIESWADLDQEDRRPGRRHLLRPDLPRAHAARGRPRASVPLHLRAVAQPLGASAATRRAARSSSPGSRCRPTCRGLVQLPDDERGLLRFIPLEDLISNHLGDLFPGMEILDHHEFRVTRNEDVEVEEDESENLVQSLERELLRRGSARRSGSRSPTTWTSVTLGLLVRELGITEQEVYRLPAPLDLERPLRGLRIDRPALKYRSTPPPRAREPPQRRTPPPRRTSFASIAEARTSCCTTRTSRSAPACRRSWSRQPPTRTCSPSSRPSTARLATAPSSRRSSTPRRRARPCSRWSRSRHGSTRQANISWARKLEKAGVHVVYGLVGLKTHCKLALVVRQEKRRQPHPLQPHRHRQLQPEDQPRLRRPRPAHCRPGRRQGPEPAVQRTERLRGREEVQAAAGRARATCARACSNASRPRRANADGRAARSGIRIKVNSIVDEQIIDALYRASQAGVPIDLVVRGICGLRPGVEGLSENIRVRSVARALPRALPHLLVRRTTATRRSSSAAPT
jgi:polyphosphate kinase